MCVCVCVYACARIQVCSCKAGDEVLVRGSIDSNLCHILRGTTVCLSVERE